jgi:hypothetical protein
MEHKDTAMHPRTLALFALLNASVMVDRTSSRPVEIDRIHASVNLVKERGGKNLRLFSMAFIEAPPRHGGFERVISPFSIAFSIDRDRVPLAYANSSFTLVGGLELKRTMFAFMAVLTYLYRRGMISERTFHRSIERSQKNQAADRIAHAVEEFPQWAANVLKTCPFLDYDASEAACAELLAYLAPVAEGVAA